MSLEEAAERAVVGSLLLEPPRHDEIREWLGVAAFYGTAEVQAYGAISALRERGAEVSPQSVDAEVREHVVRGTQLADGPWLVGVMQATPDPSRAVIYAKMVLQQEIRRRIRQDAVTLRQEGEAAVNLDLLNRAFATVDTMRRGLETLHRRESTAMELHSVTPANTGGLTQLMRFPRHEHLAAERSLVHALVVQPHAIEQLTRWLRTSDFSDAECGSLYGELTALHDANNPIDRITLAWRAARVGIEGPMCEWLTALSPEVQVAGDPISIGVHVLEQSVQSALLATSDELERVADDPSLNATSVAYARLNSLWPQQRRLIKARLSTT